MNGDLRDRTVFQSSRVGRSTPTAHIIRQCVDEAAEIIGEARLDKVAARWQILEKKGFRVLLNACEAEKKGDSSVDAETIENVGRRSPR